MKKLSFISIFYFISILLNTHGYAEQEVAIGVLKIDSIPVNQPWDPKDPSWDRNPTGANPESIFYIQVDTRKPVKITAKESGIVSNLRTDKKHLIKINLNNKRIESFGFNFKKYKCNELRLWYKPMYATWSLWPNGKDCNKE